MGIAYFTRGFLAAQAIITWVLWMMPSSWIEPLGYTDSALLTVACISLGFVGVISAQISHYTNKGR